MIHPTALVDESAQLGANVSVGPWTIIGANVTIGDNTAIASHCVIKGPASIGSDNRIFQFCSLGDEPQDKKYAGEPTRLQIGNGNVIRENCTFSRGTAQDAGVTRIGDNNWIMATVHIAHDCVIGNDIIFANLTTLGGHVHVADKVILGGGTLVHQFCHIGRYSFTGAGTVVYKDIPAYVMVNGNPASARGLNSEGLKRADFSPGELAAIKQAFKLVYKKGLRIEEALQQLHELAVAEPVIVPLLDSVRNSTRGIVR